MVLLISISEVSTNNELINVMLTVEQKKLTFETIFQLNSIFIPSINYLFQFRVLCTILCHLYTTS